MAESLARHAPIATRLPSYDRSWLRADAFAAIATRVVLVGASAISHVDTTAAAMLRPFGARRRGVVRREG